MVSLGIEELILNPLPALKGKRLGLLCNQASVDSRCRHSRDLVAGAFPGQLACLFSPQHGFFAEKQDNMIESDHMVDSVTGLPVSSLYGARRKPSPEMLDRLDVLLVDLMDVGTRVYTFIHTLSYCLEAAAECGKQVVVLDRPNPLGGLAVEGNILRDDCRSFVGLHPLPMRHGLTIAEMALFINSRLSPQADLQVLPMRGWRRQMLFRATGLPWVFPSPNMPSPETALVYPGQVIWEGTNISEGRGTTMPFELCGAPFFNHRDILARLPGIADTPGCILRPVVFEPTANKWRGQACTGFQIHVTDQKEYKPFRTSLALLQAFLALYPCDFRYKDPPYEYEFEKLPMDMILGDASLRPALEKQADLMELEQHWQHDLQEYDSRRREFFLYESA